MNTAGTIAMLTAKDPATGEYRIPHIIYSDAYYSEMVAYADLILPDTTYLERWDCISLLDRPISRADGPADAIRQPVRPPDRDVRPFQDVLLDLGARLGLPGLVNADGSRAIPGGYADYLVHHERRPGIGPLAGWRGADGSRTGRGAPNPDQLERYIEQRLLLAGRAGAGRALLQARQPGVSRLRARAWASSSAPSRSSSSSTASRCRSSAWPRRATARCSRRSAIASASRPTSIRCRSGIRRSRTRADAEAAFPLHAITQRPMAMYHSWGSQNAWLRQIHGRNRLYHAPRRGPSGSASPTTTGSGSTSRHGRIKAQVRLMDGVNPDTVWTWNAIGKRAGAWHLAPDAPEATKRLPAQSPDRRAAARARGRLSLRQRRPGDRPGGLVRPARAHRARAAAEAGLSAPQFAPLRPPAEPAGAAGDLQVRPGVPRTAMTSLPATRRARRLGLVIDLDTCVGCQACVVSCKEWNTGGYPAPLTDQDPYGAEPRGAWLNRVHGYEVGEGEGGRTVHFPQVLPALRGRRPASPSARPARPTSAPRTASCWSTRTLCIGCRLCSWACPYGARELRCRSGRDEEVHAVHRPHLQRAICAEEDRMPACVRACPTGARHFGDLGDPDSRGLAAGRRARRLRPDAGARLHAGQQIPAAAAAPDRAGLHRRPAALEPGGAARRVPRLARSRARRLNCPRARASAPSVIVFTTASGAGYGLLFLLGLAAPAGLIPATRWVRRWRRSAWRSG